MVRIERLWPSAAAALIAACYRIPEPAPATTAAPVPAPRVEVSWPTALEFHMVEDSGVIKHRGLAMFSLETRLPRFRSEPPAVGAALNARLARLAKPDVDPRTHEGSYSIDCTVSVANRFAVLLDCAQELEQRRHDGGGDGDETGGSLSRQLILGWWMRPGLPELSMTQLAPQLDLRAAIAAAAATAPAGCDLYACAFDPRSFLLDADGVTPVATEPCNSACEGTLPPVPLDRLAPTHAWAYQLVSRIRRRVDAGDELAEGNVTR